VTVASASVAQRIAIACRSRPLRASVQPPSKRGRASQPRGSVLVWHGSLWHGGGANHSDGVRVGIAMNYCAGWVRQQENQQLGLPPALVATFPDCTIKTIESIRKKKLEAWDRNKETNRAWLSLNMMTEANAGFRAFHYGTKQQREVNFIKLRQRLAQNAAWNEELIEEIAPWVPSGEGVTK